MSNPRTKRRYILAATVVLLIVAAFLGARWLERSILLRSERILTDLSGTGSTINIGSVEIHLMRGDILWSKLRIDQPINEPDTAAGDRAMRMSGRAEQISVHGLSLWRLLFANELSVHAVVIDRPDMEMILMNDTSAQHRQQPREVILSAFNADSVILMNGVYRMHRTGDSSEVTVDTVDLRVANVRSHWGTMDPIDLHFGAALGHLRGLHATFPPLYDLRVAGIELLKNGKSLQVTGATFKPLKGPEEYDRWIHFETDLISARMDTTTVDGVDLADFIRSFSLTATSVRVAGVDLNVFRDKTMPDEPYKEKPLPARLVRELPLRLCVDSLVLDRWNVQYHEKNTLTPEFGEVEFTDLAGLVTGVCNMNTSRTDTLVIVAKALGYGKAQVHLKVRTVVADSSDRFIVNATIGGMSFSLLNRMITDLLLLRATSGTIGGIDLTMTADDERASGRVDVEYDGLTFEILKRDGARTKETFMSGLANLAVHKRNLRSSADFRHGDFSFQRKKERSIFNYLLSGAREGMIITMLPGVLEQVRQMDRPATKN